MPTDPTTQNVPTSPVVENPTLADAPLETQQVAAVIAGRMATSGNDAVLQEQVQRRVGDIDQAVALRAQQAQAMVANEQAALQQAERERVLNVSAEGQPSALRAPTTNAMQHRAAEASPPGIHPDVTSPTTAPPGDVKIPGTGVAEITDLAPGQDLSPSPPVSSSNIVPTPNKPGSLFAQL